MRKNVEKVISVHENVNTHKNSFMALSEVQEKLVAFTWRKASSSLPSLRFP